MNLFVGICLFDSYWYILIERCNCQITIVWIDMLIRINCCVNMERLCLNARILPPLFFVLVKLLNAEKITVTNHLAGSSWKQPTNKQPFLEESVTCLEECTLLCLQEVTCLSYTINGVDLMCKLYTEETSQCNIDRYTSGDNLLYTVKVREILSESPRHHILFRPAI